MAAVAWPTPLYTSQAPTGGQGKSSDVGVLLAKLVSGKLRFARTIYTVNGNESAANGDTINIALLKTGARVIPEQSFIMSLSGAANNNLVLNIGDTNNALRYSNGLTVFGNSASNAVLQPSLFSNCTSPLNTTVFAPADIFPPPLAFPLPTPVGTNDQAVVVAKLVSATNLAANSLIMFNVAYVDE